MRRAKSIEKLRGDPRYDFEVGRLLGCAMTTAHWMLGSDDSETKRMGERLQGQTAFFLEGEEVDKWERSPTLPPSQKP